MSESNEDRIFNSKLSKVKTFRLLHQFISKILLLFMEQPLGVERTANVRIFKIVCVNVWTADFRWNEFSSHDRVESERWRESRRDEDYNLLVATAFDLGQILRRTPCSHAHHIFSTFWWDTFEHKMCVTRQPATNQLISVSCIVSISRWYCVGNRRKIQFPFRHMVIIPSPWTSPKMGWKKLGCVSETKYRTEESGRKWKGST